MALPTTQPTDQPINESADESRKQRIAYGPSDEPTDIPANEGTDQCTDESTDNADYKSINGCTNTSSHKSSEFRTVRGSGSFASDKKIESPEIHRLRKYRLNPPMVLPTTQLTNQPTNQPTNQRN
jgi:hypothetical protein